jgi:hypothetical protein
MIRVCLNEDETFKGCEVLSSLGLLKRSKCEKLTDDKQQTQSDGKSSFQPWWTKYFLENYQLLPLVEKVVIFENLQNHGTDWNQIFSQNAGTAHPPGADEIILNSDHCFYTVGYTNYNLIHFVQFCYPILYRACFCF